MKALDQLIAKISRHLAAGTFEQLETETRELKDNSANASQWDEIHKTTCAFLNTNAGIILVGVKENGKEGRFEITGYNPMHEEKTKAMRGQFKSQEGSNIDCTHLIEFETRELGGKTILAILVDELPYSQKYAFYKGKAYRRTLTGDEKLAQKQITIHNGYKQEMQMAQEVQPFPMATLEDLNLDRINEYIYYLNQELKTETPKTSIAEALSFLKRKRFVAENTPTLLGMLVAGQYPEDFLQYRATVDGYVEVPGSEEIATNTKRLRNNILPLMEDSLRFVLQNIPAKLTHHNGGTAEPAYPEKLVRESLNNALAHRDYSENHWVTLTIVAGQHIEIQNPGSLKPALLMAYKAPDQTDIRRVIPGNPSPNNPKLADVLKLYKKWEGKGYGMATLVNECLNNKIGVPYYKLNAPNRLSLVLPQGPLLTAHMEALFHIYTGLITSKLKQREVTPDQKVVLAYLYQSDELNRNQHAYTILLSKDNNHREAIRGLEEAGLVYQEKAEEATDGPPVYRIMPGLFQETFNEELAKQYQEEVYYNLQVPHRAILNAVYACNQYGGGASRYPTVGFLMDYFRAKGEPWLKPSHKNDEAPVRRLLKDLTTGNYLTDRSKANAEKRKPEAGSLRGPATYQLNSGSAQYHQLTLPF